VATIEMDRADETRFPATSYQGGRSQSTGNLFDYPIIKYDANGKEL
jgi:hypothetical protein